MRVSSFLIWSRLRVVPGVTQQLGCDVPRRAALRAEDDVSARVRHVDLGAAAVRDLDRRVVGRRGQQDVLGLEVAVRHAALVQEVQRLP